MGTKPGVWAGEGEQQGYDAIEVGLPGPYLFPVEGGWKGLCPHTVTSHGNIANTMTWLGLKAKL